LPALTFAIVSFACLACWVCRRRTAGAQRLCIFPYHKSVLDWLTCDAEATWLSSADYPGPGLRVHPSAGHALAAAACHAAALALPLADPEAPVTQPAAQTPDERQAYMLRHAVAHLCLAADTVRQCDARPVPDELGMPSQESAALLQVAAQPKLHGPKSALEPGFLFHGRHLALCRHGWRCCCTLSASGRRASLRVSGWR
jgi:hypothetical protein